jgi:hypothetical protein
MKLIRSKTRNDITNLKSTLYLNKTDKIKKSRVRMAVHLSPWQMDSHG